ncbi:hypothetical protein [Sphingomonas psychrotolerans]|uniref:Uncharacterized protein n=1 Tax=Sphingomonas psychrotolerans TaxID=1327635 RepID=A0A2K8MAP6_9SPHN|nr:hypothetical protein [Sphingomonas psychrotolerans]ATY30950.1 hypothetical protein CVN68_02235 [Sphingomonas psychrotolerans]
MGSSISDLLPLLAKRPIGGYGRAWVGARPLPAPSLIAAIAGTVGLMAEGRESDFVRVSREDISIWLTLFATHSLLHGHGEPARGLDEQVALAINSMEADASFFSKGQWEFTRRGKLYQPVSRGNGWERRRHRLWYRSESEPLPPST